jgi:VWFA-related protein
VSVDVIVRDRQGRPITDLRSGDFEVLEDGVRQDITNVRLVTPQPTATARPSTADPSSPAAQSPANSNIETATFKALVFDRLSPEARALAVKGAVAALESRADDFVGVFIADLRLETVQTYTNDASRVRKAIEEAGTRATSSFTRDGARVGSAALGDRNPAISPTAGAEFQGSSRASPTQPAAAAGGDPSTRIIQAMVSRMERTYEMLVRDQQGLATTDALLAVIDGLAQLPGRKSVVFLAEGLALPPRVMARFDSVVASANRANVTIYTVDAAGLRTQSSTAETARQVQALAARSIGDEVRLDSSAWSQDFEVNEDVLRQDPSVSLKMLAERTGGVLINNTNNLEQGLRQIDVDARSYYLIDYVPKNLTFAGEWRTITVKVPGRNSTVRARAGYLAVHQPGVLPLLTFEGPAIAALEASPRPTELPVRASAWSFPGTSGETRVAVLAAAPLAVQTFAQEGQTFRTDFTLLVRIRNADGEIVRKASQPYRLTGPASQLGTARRGGDVLLFRQISLPPGAYTVEYAVHDALAKKSGAGSRPITILPSGTPGMSVSSLLIVRRTERQPAQAGEAPNLLRYDDLLLYPNLGEPVSKSQAKTLSFFLVISPPSGQPAPTAALQILQGGTAIGEIPMTLSAAASDGVIRHAGQLPLANFPVGSYELRIVLTQGKERQIRAAAFDVID